MVRVNVVDKKQETVYSFYDKESANIFSNKAINLYGENQVKVISNER